MNIIDLLSTLILLVCSGFVVATMRNHKKSLESLKRATEILEAANKLHQRASVAIKESFKDAKI